MDGNSRVLSSTVNSLSSSVVNSLSTAVAEALLLDTGKTCEGVAVTVAVLYTFAEEPKCKVSTVLNNRVGDITLCPFPLFQALCQWCEQISSI